MPPVFGPTLGGAASGLGGGALAAVPGASFSVAGGRFSVAGGRASVDMLEEACYRYWEGAKSANFFFNELFINASAHTPDTHI